LAVQDEIVEVIHKELNITHSLFKLNIVRVHVCNLGRSWVAQSV